MYLMHLCRCFLLLIAASLWPMSAQPQAFGFAHDTYSPGKTGGPASYRIRFVFNWSPFEHEVKLGYHFAPFRMACTGLNLRRSEANRDWKAQEKCYESFKILESPRRPIQPIGSGEPPNATDTHTYFPTKIGKERLRALIEFDHEVIELTVELVTLPYEH
jgi:hypothetical protein